MTSRKDATKIVRELRRQHFAVELANSGHWHVIQGGRRILTMAQSPSDWRAIRNDISDLRKFGFVWPPPGRKGKAAR